MRDTVLTDELTDANRSVLPARARLVPEGNTAESGNPNSLHVGRPRPVLSVVIPVYNEAEVLPEFHRRLAAVLDKLCWPSETIYVNDGSTDLSTIVIQDLHGADGRVAFVNLSRNFGKEVAVTAGLDHVRGEIAVVIDADLQDPPEVIPLFINKWLEGYDMVYAKRRERKGETWLKRATASAFYRVIHNIGDAPIPADTGDFRLLNRRCIDALASCRERRRFMKGLFAWVGFKHAAISYDRDPRFRVKRSGTIGVCGTSRSRESPRLRSFL